MVTTILYMCSQSSPSSTVQLIFPKRMASSLLPFGNLTGSVRLYIPDDRAPLTIVSVTVLFIAVWAGIWQFGPLGFVHSARPSVLGRLPWESAADRKSVV